MPESNQLIEVKVGGKQRSRRSRSRREWVKKGEERKTKIRVQKNKYINSFWTFNINLNKDAR